MAPATRPSACAPLGERVSQIVGNDESFSLTDSLVFPGILAYLCRWPVRFRRDATDSLTDSLRSSTEATARACSRISCSRSSWSIAASPASRLAGVEPKRDASGREGAALRPCKSGPWQPSTLRQPLRGRQWPIPAIGVSPAITKTRSGAGFYCQFLLGAPYPEPKTSSSRLASSTRSAQPSSSSRLACSSRSSTHAGSSPQRRASSRFSTNASPV